MDDSGNCLGSGHSGQLLPRRWCAAEAECTQPPLVGSALPSVVGTLPSTTSSARPKGILLGTGRLEGPHIKSPGSWGPLQSPLPFLA